MKNPYLGAIVMDFMPMLKFIDYNKFKRFPNAADEISAKLAPSFLECEVLVVVPDRYYFKFPIKAAERKRRTDDSTHMHEIEIIGNEKVTLGIRTIKQTW